MFTQCPDCQTTFRVSTKVLEQADGRVRCGGCGNAFNALEHLAEDDKHEAESEDQAVEQTTAPDDVKMDQNKDLLDTLDKLAGPEVRIEDTGVEWLVLDEGDEDALPPEPGGEGETDEEAPEKPVLHGRHNDLPEPVSDKQESLDLPETEEARPPLAPSERRYDDSTVLPEEFGDDDGLDELPFLAAPETPKRRASDREEARDTSAFDEAQADLSLSEPEDWVELLDEVDIADQLAEEVSEAIAGADSEVTSEVPAEEENADTDIAGPEAVDEEPVETTGESSDEDQPSYVDLQFMKQVKELGLEITGNHEIADDEDEASELPDAVEDEPGGEIDGEAAAEGEEAEAPQAEKETDLEESALEEEDTLAAFESSGEFEARISAAAKALAGEDLDEAGDSDDEQAEVYIEPEKPEHVVPPQTEEEMTINQQIDEELLRATQTFDVFASAKIESPKVSQFIDEDSPMVETIIMEGEMVRDALQEERRELDSPDSEFKSPGRLEDTYSLNRGQGKIRGGRRAGDPPSYTVIASVALLGLLLVGQIMHQSRQALATYGAFNHTIGPIYRALGQPVTPDWDIKGWQFEATNGSVDEREELLTIYSRIANKSSQSLPYPLVHVSLTDRWEEIIGSRVLEPNEYLAGDLDPRKPVPFGENFNAVITIASPSAEATGFKLNVCYRVAQGRVRCATGDFKD
jgi:predicted Zn finger-like uncharacterized protein